MPNVKNYDMRTIIGNGVEDREFDKEVIKHISLSARKFYGKIVNENLLSFHYRTKSSNSNLGIKSLNYREIDIRKAKRFFDDDKYTGLINKRTEKYILDFIKENYSNNPESFVFHLSDNEIVNMEILKIDPYSKYTILVIDYENEILPKYISYSFYDDEQQTWFREDYFFNEEQMSFFKGKYFSNRILVEFSDEADESLLKISNIFIKLLGSGRQADFINVFDTRCEVEGETFYRLCTGDLPISSRRFTSEEFEMMITCINKTSPVNKFNIKRLLAKHKIPTEQFQDLLEVVD